MEKEIWKSLEKLGYEYHYVSDLGNIKTDDREVINTIYGSKRLIKGQIIKSFERKGYRYVSLRKGGKKKNYLIHRLVATMFVKGDNSLTVNHIDGNKLNNNYSNLEWVTQQENAQHAVKTGLHTNFGQRSIKCIETGVEYKSLKEAAEKLNFKSVSSIWNVLNEVSKTAKGSTFRYLTQKQQQK